MSFKDNEKLTEVLELFLSPNYNIISSTYLDLLLTHVSEKAKELTESNNEYCQIFQAWVLKALDVWNTGVKPCQAVVAFTLKLVGLIAHNEFHFHYWYRENTYQRLCTVLCLREDNLSALVKSAYLVMLSNLIDHSSGRQWIIESGVWKDVAKFAHLNYTMYITRDSQKFLWTLLLLESENTKVCEEVILVAAGPLINNTLNSQMHSTLEVYLDKNKVLCTSMDLLSSILENTLFVSMDNTIPLLLDHLTNLETRVKALFEACISTHFLQRLHKLLLLVLFLRLKQGIKGPSEPLEESSWEKFRLGLYYINMMLITKKYILDIIKTAKVSLVYWKKICNLCEFKLPDQYKFEYQAIALMVAPLCVCMKTANTSHDFFETFINKIFEITCTYTQRLAYNMRDIMLKEDLPLEQICKISIHLFLEIVNIMDRDVAVITFQTMCYVLKNYVPDECDNVTNYLPFGSGSSVPSDLPRRPVYRSLLERDPIVNNPMLLSSILDGLAIITEKFKLKWQECVETICVLSLAQGILNHPGTLPKLTVQALKLCKLAIQNFMPPNLALLVDSESHMDELGATLFKRIHDTNWEVRDSVLEVLNVIATISEDKYPAFQDFLLANQFLQLALDIATKDSDSYVRSSALIFLSTTVRINKLWDNKLYRAELPEVAIRLIKEESEAIVRREAVILVRELYTYRKWPKQTIDDMTQVMAVTAVLDLHWEVKINALGFWKTFIHSHMTDQGMLDGIFPSVTFSKEHRKIVELNETEIKRRINKAMDEMAKQRCLGVLLATLKDESDFQVSKASSELINKCKTFLLRYKLIEPKPGASSSKDRSTLDSLYNKNTLSTAKCRTTEIFQDSSGVIDEIVNTTDMNLLSSIYKNSMKMECEYEKTDQEKLQFVSCVTREDFLHTIFNSDIDGFIEERSRWLRTYTNSIDSVLEDILSLHQRKDANTMDCY